MSDYWFKPKAYGYGATPADWKGRAATLGFVVLALVTTTLMAWPAKAGAGPAIWPISTWLALVTLLTLAFYWVCRVKTDGQRGWRWGK